jgi:hypothetical protein
MAISRFVPLVVVLLLTATSVEAARKPKQPKQPSAESLIDQATAAVENGTADPARDLAPLLERLRTTADESEQDDLIDAIEELGEHDGYSPAAVKAYLRDAAPPVLLAVARSTAPGMVRCDALMVLRGLNVADSVLDEAVAIANADTSADQRAIKFRGELLANWKASGGRPVVEPNPSVSPAREKAALDFLRQNRRRVSADILALAALHGEAEVVAALLDAGIDVNVNLGGGDGPLDRAAGAGCVDDEAGTDRRLATIDILLQRGADIRRKDGRGNTILMGAVYCPPPVVDKLIAAGASIDAVNMQGFSALHMAFATGNWDIAELLVERGARLSKKAIDDLFFEKPTDPDKLALVKRATKK